MKYHLTFLRHGESTANAESRLQGQWDSPLTENGRQQARRLADRTMFLWNGEIIELDQNEVIFSDKTKDQRTYQYVNGIFG